jgi:hypothetical protein
MNKHYISLLALFCFCKLSYGQHQFGPRLTALGNNSGAVFDIWNILGNSAGITKVEKSTAAINYSRHSIDNELSTQALALIIPLNNDFIGISFQKYGLSVYNEINAGLALAKKFGDELSISLKGNYHQIQITGYGAASSYSINVGAIYQFNEKITVGIYSSNISNRGYINVSSDLLIPSGINLGLSYQASKKVLIAATLNKNTWILIPFVPDWRWGLDRNDCPWYSTASLYRQTIPSSWAEPLNNIIKDLTKLIVARTVLSE